MSKSYLSQIALLLQLYISCASPPAAAAVGPTLTVAIIDTGIDPEHPDLKSALWRNSKEAPNGKDDDRNGLVDDLQGWDFVKNCGRHSDEHGHGTHIAGIIHKIAPQAKLMILRFYAPDLSASQTIHNTALAIRYAVKMGAQIINYSGGGATPHQEELEALKEAEKSGILVVAAAGNESSNTDTNGYYPADYPLKNILSIASHDLKGRLLESSNFGHDSVDLSAPGANIESTLPGGGYGEMTGTSQATAHVTGAAALAWLKFPYLREPFRMIEHLKETGQFAVEQVGKSQSGRKLSIRGSLESIERGLSADFRYFYDGNDLLDGVANSNVTRKPSSPAGSWGLAMRLIEKVDSSGSQNPYKARRLPRD